MLPNGQYGVYDKRHRFAFAGEDNHYTAGTKRLIASVKGWKINLQVCYDLRFPELFRALNAELLLLPSSFTYTTGQAHWDVLMRARAIENLAYLVAPAQGGVHSNGRQTWGHSLVVDPWGQLLAQQATGPGVVVTDIDISNLRAFRQQLPALTHRVL